MDMLLGDVEKEVAGGAVQVVVLCSQVDQVPDRGHNIFFIIPWESQIRFFLGLDLRSASTILLRQVL